MTSENVGLICLCNKYCGVFAPCKNCWATETAVLSNTRTQQ
jgi:hypothetical protein